MSELDIRQKYNQLANTGQTADNSYGRAEVQ